MLFPDQSTEPGSIEFVIDPSYLAGIQLTYLVDILPFLHMIRTLGVYLCNQCRRFG
jgi:hypothetical protein